MEEEARIKRETRREITGLGGSERHGNGRSTLVQSTSHLVGKETGLDLMVVGEWNLGQELPCVGLEGPADLLISFLTLIQIEEERGAGESCGT